ncbi:penta-EF hand domain-containing protein 2-like isoform X2 [Papaver somniferum]|uniref:penta-EF hand domain-containing protein 2-like isoform X2 n=1 Tax=Papaver somniferum TaxID=3469 RepID=UPI000E70093B|nr:penta-EF hand domain-containing protein 2-like isoform X2 [Papaver somniferum]
MENIANLREWFGVVDSNHTGNITAPQLQRAFSIGNLEFSISIVQQMIRMYDFDKNGTMSFEEFVALNKFLLKVQQAFADLERGRGYLGTDDAYESFDKNKSGKFRLDDFISLSIFLQSARNLFNSFDTAKQGRVTLDLNQFVFCAANCRI